MRATIGGPLLDVQGDRATIESRALSDLAELDAFGPRIGRSLAPHAIYTVSEGLLRWTVEQARIAARGAPSSPIPSPA